MTRETKVGLVVAGSFVCLVSVVVASRLHPKADDTPTEEKIAQGPAAKSDTPTSPKNEGKATAPGAKVNPPGIIPAGLTTSVPPPLSPPSPPALPQVPAQVDAGPALGKKEKTKKGSADTNPEATAEAEHQKRMQELAELMAKEPNNNATPTNIPGRPTGDAALPLPVNTATVPAPPLPTANPIAFDNNGLPAAASVAANNNKAPTGPRPFVGPLLEVAEKAPIVPPPVAPMLPAPPPVAASQTIPPPQAVQPTQVADLNPKAAVSNTVKEVTNPNLPAMGSKTRNDGAPSPIPSAFTNAPTTAPKVTSITLQTYVCQPEDTTFEAVSTRNFGSPKYARALLQYNRGDPRAKDNLRQDNPRLLAGQEVYIPPRDFLENRFGDFIDNRVTPVAAAVSISAPLNANAPSVAAGTSTIGRTPNPPLPTKDATKPYRVAGDGQMLIEIAQQTLGDRGRWSEIYRLNPTIRPEYPVPGGTEILGSSRVDLQACKLEYSIVSPK